MEKREKDNGQPRERRSANRSFGTRTNRDSRPFSGRKRDSGKTFHRDGERRFDKDGERHFDNDRSERRFNKFAKDGVRARKSGGHFEKHFDERHSERPRRKFDSSNHSEERFEGRPARKFTGFRSAEDRIRAKRETSNDRRKYFDKKEGRTRKRDVTAESEILSEIVAKRHSEGRYAPQRQKVLSLEFEEQHGPMRLNKYIANAGICSRRDADVLIESGAISVNGEVVTELGTKVMPTDEVRYGDQVLQREKPVFVLLNKPKDYITTLYDERGRKNVLDLVRGACKERIYPVGRLDKNTTGVLLFTNDGEMTKKLTHPRSNVQKTYHVELDKNLTHADFQAIAEGIELDDGVIKPDELSYVGDSKSEIGITIHSGKNRIVRRIFEHFDYQVIKLDRVVFAGLTKKDLPRGSWRFLTPAEINILHVLPKQQPLA